MSIKTLSTKFSDELKAVKFVGFKQAFFGTKFQTWKDIADQVAKNWDTARVLTNDDGLSTLRTTGSLDLMDDYFGSQKVNDYLYNNGYETANVCVDMMANEMMDLENDYGALDPVNTNLRQQDKERFNQLDDQQTKAMFTRTPLYKFDSSQRWENVRPVSAEEAKDIVKHLAKD